MNSHLTRLLAVAASMAVLALAACGEKDEPATTGPIVTTSASTTTSTSASTTTNGGPNGGTPAPQRVRAAIEAFLTSRNAAAVCDRTLTARFLSKAYGDRKGCLAARKPATLAASAEVSGISVTSDRATARATAKGGIYAGQRLDFTLVLTGAAWRIDQLNSNVKVGP